MASTQTASNAPLPPSVLFPLLKALGPEKISKSKFKAPSGERVDARDKRDFLSIVDAAKKSKTPAQFTKLLSPTFNNRDGGGASIIKATVEYTKNGYTIVTIVYSDNRTFISTYPTS